MTSEPPDRESKQRSAAADLVAVLFDEGVSHLFLNPGMQVAPLREALSEAQAAGLPHPKPVLCAHEHVALSAAHGHHLLGAGPEAVMVHVEGGNMNLDTALENAHRDHVPVTVFSSRPLDDGRRGAGLHDDCGPEERQPPAARPSRRGSGKWATEVTGGRELGTLVRRAFQIARAEPSGPAYVTLPREMLRQPAGRPSRRLPPPRPPAPDATALEEMAELLAAAEAPIIIAGRVGRNLAAMTSLARLAETLAAPVIDFRHHVNLPANHALNGGLEGREFVLQADAILLLDVELPCLPGLGPLPAEPWLLQIDIDCLKPSVAGWTYPIEIAITADTALALPRLDSLLADRLSSRGRKVQERRRHVEEALNTLRQGWRQRATSEEPEELPDAMLAELNQALPEDAVVLEEAAASTDAVLRQVERPPGHFFRLATSGSGWSIGAALGARVARPTQPVVALCDETAFNFGLPAAAFWSAHRAEAAFLTVVLNRSYRRPPRQVGSRPTSRPAVHAESDVVTVARACGAEGRSVDHPSEVADAVERLLAMTRDGVCAVLELQLPA